jgi:hypothetical protein
MRRAGWILLAGAIAVPLPVARPAAAQGRIPRQWVYAAGGIAVGLGITALYSGRHYGQSLGWCSTVRCVGIFSTTAGGFVGYLIGYEVESKYRQRYRLAPPIEFTGRTRLLRTRATGFELDRTLVAVLGDEGVEMIGTGTRLEYLGQRARGLRDISDVSLRTDAANMLVGTASGLYLYAVAGRADGLRTLSGEVSAVAARGTRVAVATAAGVRVGAIVGDSVEWRGDSSALGDRVADLRWENDTLLWVLTESGLTAFSIPADSAPVRLGTVEVRGPARRLVIDTVARAVAVAAGAEGVYLVRTSDPAVPRVVAHWNAARYVYDVAFWGGGTSPQLFAGAGPEGLYLLQLDGGRLKPVGLVNNVGFVAALAVGPDALYALDRTGGVLRRLEPPRPAVAN